MGDLTDYLAWRGDLTFLNDPFNEVDNLLISELIYTNFDMIVPSITEKQSITLREASALFFQKHSEEELKKDKSLMKNIPFLMKKMAESRRFGQVLLCNYVNKIDYKEEKQFCAMHVILGDKSRYIAYRGTDDTLVGWKEDFHMSFIMPVPSQIEAVSYLEETTKNSTDSLRLGGHSKGGNLAIYSAVKCNLALKEQIIEVYNNDGPGFKKEMLQETDYQQMLPYITTIVPQSSIVGMLLEHEEEYQVVKSKQAGFMQHDGMSWEVMGNHFVHLDDVTKESHILDTTLKTWINSLTIKQREQFVDVLFTALEATGAKNVSQLTSGKLKNLNIIMKSYSTLDSQTKEVIIFIIKSLVREYNHVLKKRGSKKLIP